MVMANGCVPKRGAQVWGCPSVDIGRDKARDSVHVCGREGVAERTEGGPPPQKAQMQNTNVIDTHRPDRSQREL